MPPSFALTRRAVLLGAAATPLMAARRSKGPVRAQDDLAGLVDPHMRMAPSEGPAAVPTVAVTLDACDGEVDRRILDLLLTERIAATIFVTGIWLRRNREAFKEMLDHPELIEIGDHGARHEAAIDRQMVLWHVVHAAGSPEAIRQEVAEGAVLLEAAGAPRPGWYRSAAALYSPQAIPEILSMNYRIAGYSLNADEGASLGAAATAHRIAAARDGDVLIAHINQPHRPAGAGVVDGLKNLKSKGFRFTTLSDPRVRIVGAA